MAHIVYLRTYPVLLFDHSCRTTPGPFRTGKQPVLLANSEGVETLDMLHEQLRFQSLLSNT